MINEEEDTKPDTSDWDCEKEIQLFYAMAKYKPVGINKHFHMISIREKFSNSISKEVTTKYIWDHLKEFYNLDLLEAGDNEPLPFPNHEVDFELPENEFGHLKKQKCKENMLADDFENLRKDRVSTPVISTRKRSDSSHASTETLSIKSEKDYDKRRDSRDSNASGPRDNLLTPRSLLQRSQTPKSSPVSDEEPISRRGSRRANTSTPTAVPAKRRRI